MEARTFAALLGLGCAAFLLSNCSSSDSSNTPTAGSPAVAGAGNSAGAPAAAGAPAGGGGSTSVGGGGSAGMAVAGGGSAAVAGGGGASGGASQAGNGGAGAGAGGQATGGGSSAGAGGHGDGNGFVLTSSKLTAGMAFPADFTCAGADHSPPFSWGPGPSTTMSYALVLQDTNNNLNHWVLYDIPSASTSLAESLETTSPLTLPAGAKQKAYSGNGYMGPCPSGMTHTYTFTLYALDVATLPGVTASTATTALVTAIQAHDLTMATLSATSNATKK